MDLRTALDSLLAGLEESGHRPISFQVREEDWVTLRDELSASDAADQMLCGERSYRDIPVEYASASMDYVAGVTAEGGVLRTAGN